jgi:hypothetical protein
MDRHGPGSARRLYDWNPDWAAQLSEVGVPAGGTTSAAFALAESLGLDPVVGLPRSDGSALALTRNPIGLSVTPPRYRTAPPRLPQE